MTLQDVMGTLRQQHEVFTLSGAYIDVARLLDTLGTVQISVADTPLTLVKAAVETGSTISAGSSGWDGFPTPADVELLASGGRTSPLVLPVRLLVAVDQGMILMPTLGLCVFLANEDSMGRIPSPQDEWRFTNHMWTRSFHIKGIYVRLFQKRRDGKFYREVRRAGFPKDRKCIDTYDRDEAAQIGQTLLAKLVLDEPERPCTVATDNPRGLLTLGEVLHRYMHESVTFLDNGDSSRRAAATQAKMLLAYFTADCDVNDLCANDVVAYTQWRCAGGFVYGIDARTGTERRGRPVRVRSADADLVLLYMALKWATTVRVGKGKRLLDCHPLQGIPRLREQNPKRPIATWERYQRTRAAARALADRGAVEHVVATSDRARAAAAATRHYWLRVELFLMLLEATGRRANAVRQLRWSDLQMEHAQIVWPATTDKKRRRSVIPMPETLVAELRQFRQHLGIASESDEWLFPSPLNPAVPVNRDVLPQALVRVEQHAGLPKLDGGVCHPYRRKWATERKGQPIKDVAAAGGWKDLKTLSTCYQQADRHTLLSVMNEPTKLTDAVVLGS